MEWIEIALRWIVGAQLIFWGLNGFFHWLEIPPSSDVITKFAEACVNTRFIMPTVKIIEIGAGLLLILNWSILIPLLLLAPLMFIITGLHVFHSPKPWGVVLPLSFPYLFLVLLHIKGFSELFKF